MHSPLRIVVIGLGKQAVNDHLPAITESDMFELVAVCDTNAERAQQIGTQYNVPYHYSLTELLSVQHTDVALLTLPHAYYLEAIEQLAEQGIHIIKEKPFATSMEEAVALHGILTKYQVYLGVTLQRRFNPVFQAFPQLLRRIGKLTLIEANYTFNIPDVGIGWRARKDIAGGGALIDMGYHIIDLLHWYFGLPDSVTARLSRGNREGQEYDVEDTASLLIDYAFGGDYATKTLANVLISRVYPTKHEELKAMGTKGSILLQRGLIQRLDREGNVLEELFRKGGWPSAAVDQLEHHGQRIMIFEPSAHRPCHKQVRHTAIVHAAYLSDARHTSVSPRDILREFGFEVN